MDMSLGMILSRVMIWHLQLISCELPRYNVVDVEP